MNTTLGTRPRSTVDTQRHTTNTYIHNVSLEMRLYCSSVTFRKCKILAPVLEIPLAHVPVHFLVLPLLGRSLVIACFPKFVFGNGDSEKRRPDRRIRSTTSLQKIQILHGLMKPEAKTIRISCASGRRLRRHSNQGCVCGTCGCIASAQIWTPRSLKRNL